MHSGFIITLLICDLLTFSGWACICPSSSENAVHEKVLDTSPEEEAEESTAPPGIDSIKTTISDEQPLPDNEQFFEESEPARSSDGDDCGRSWYFREDRIVGGTDADIREYPWLVRLEGHYGYCGGTIIDEYWVLTAAQCIIDQAPNDFEVVFGDTNPYVLENGEYRRTPSAFYTHPAYDYNANEFDLGLVKFDSPLNLSSWNVKKACLSETSCEVCLPEELAVVTGWGTVDNGALPDTLQEVFIKIISLDECRKAWGHFNTVTQNMLCTLPKVNDGSLAGTCNGDSGGPVGKTSGDRFTICGVASWGSVNTCGSNIYPDVFSQVCTSFDWIEGMMTCNEEPVDNICPGMCSEPCPWNGFCIGKNSCFCVSGHDAKNC